MTVFLRSTCCRFTQGDYVCRALSVDEFGALHDRAVSGGGEKPVNSVATPAGMPQHRLMPSTSGNEHMIFTNVWVKDLAQAADNSSNISN